MQIALTRVKEEILVGAELQEANLSSHDDKCPSSKLSSMETRQFRSVEQTACYVCIVHYEELITSGWTLRKYQTGGSGVIVLKTIS